MRNIYIKAAAFIIGVICVAMIVYTGCNTVVKCIDSYDFADSFEKSVIPHTYLANTFSEGKGIPDEDDGVEYYIYIKESNSIHTNTGIADKSYYENATVNEIVEPVENMVTAHYRLFSNGDFLYAKLTDEKYAQLESEWIEGEKAVKSATNVCIVYLAAIIISAVYLLWTCGRKNKSDDVHMLLIDRLPVEITISLCGMSIIPCIAAMIIFIDEYNFGTRFWAHTDFISKGMSIAFVTSYALVAMFILSLVRNLKNRTFLQRSIVFKVIRFLWRVFVKISKKIYDIAVRFFGGINSVWKMIFRGNREILLFIAYSIAVFVLTIGLWAVTDWLVPFVFLGILGVAALRYVYKRISGIERVCEGARLIRSGNVEHVIAMGGDARTDELADNINCIADGLRESVKREVQAERMKAELITNVSHDLKTPLTAIINYADLLSEMKLEPNEANDYAVIIKKKGERLKKLTNDLFDISKANNGAEEVNFEQIDIALLMRQSLGELDEGIQKSGLDFRVNIPENEVNIIADGKKMSRVFENLIHNILKYSMEKSRVYISLLVNDGKVCAEFKNISVYPMDFDGDYITERFVRGDKSRASDGSGLGLAIAKSYTQLCGGEFGVTVDGDLFKASVRFDSVK